MRKFWLLLAIFGRLLEKTESRCNLLTIEGASLNDARLPDYETGRRLRFECNVGYNYNTRAGNYFNAVCRDDGSWDFNGTCSAVSCPYPSRPRMFTGTQQQLFVPGDIARLTCFPGLEVQAPGPAGTLSFEVTCEEVEGTLVWLPDWLCGKRTCGPVPSVANAVSTYTMAQPTAEGRYEVGTTVRVVCEIGRQVSNNFASSYDATCDNEANWSPNFPPCLGNTPIPVENFRRFGLRASVINLEFLTAYGDTGSQDYRTRTQSLSIALDQCFETIYGQMFLGTEDYSFSSADGDGNNLAFETVLVFQPYMFDSPETLVAKFREKIEPNSFTATDPTTDPPTEYIFQASAVAASMQGAGILFADGSCSVARGMTMGENIAFGVMGGVVALLSLLIAGCCCYRTDCCTAFPATNHNRTCNANMQPLPRLRTYRPASKPDILLSRDPPPSHFGLFQRPVYRMLPAYNTSIQRRY